VRESVTEREGDRGERGGEERERGGGRKGKGKREGEFMSRDAKALTFGNCVQGLDFLGPFTSLDPGERDLVYVKRDLVYVKRDLVYVKRDLVYVKRDLVYVKRDLPFTSLDPEHCCSAFCLGISLDERKG
jgi:hypothetical protein